MKWSFEGKWLAAGVSSVFLLMGFVSFISYQNTSEIVESADRVQYTYEVLSTLTEYDAAMTVAESGRRGYVFLGNTQELSRYQQAIATIHDKLATLQRQTHHDPEQEQLVRQLLDLTHQRLELLERSIDLYQQNPIVTDTQTAITESSIQIRDRIQATLSEFKTRDEQLLQRAIQQSRSNTRQRVMLESISTLLSFAIIFGVFYGLYSQWKQRRKLELIQRDFVQEQEISALKLRLFSMISHEFRTPLSVILASSQLLGEILQDTLSEINAETKLKNLYRIQSSAKLMNQLLTDILTLTRAEAGRLECKPEPIDVEAFCLNLVEDIQFLIPSQHTIEFTSKGRCGRANLDEKLLYSILNNLLLNAIKYSSSDSSIQLNLICKPDILIFQVKDEGIGISLNDQPRIFEPLYRGKNAEHITGTGLGLAVVQKCLELHKGTIAIQSDVGKGTTFVVEIPRFIQPLVMGKWGMDN